MNYRLLFLTLILTVCFFSCDLENEKLLPTKSEIIKAVENTGASNVIVNSYMYADNSFNRPSINTNGGIKGTNIYNIEVRVTFSGSISNTTVENAIKQLFINNDFSSSDITVYASLSSLPQQPDNIETLTLPTHQNIIDAVEEFSATNVTITTYTSSGNTVSTEGGTARSNSAIVIRVNYSFNGLGTVIPSQAAVTLSIRNLFTGFTSLTASVTPTALYPMPSHSSLISIASQQGANNIKILEYTANNEVIDEFYYGSKPNTTLIKISITFDLGANVTSIGQSVRGLFQHFTDVTISTMLTPPTREEITNALTECGATSVDIVTYTIGGSTSNTGYKAINVAIRLIVNYSTLYEISNGQIAVKNLFTGFTNATIFVGNDLPYSLPTQSQVLSSIHGNTNDFRSANINTYTVNGIEASSLSFATSIDTIIIRIRATTWVSTGLGWDLGYVQIISDTADVAINAKNRVRQLFINNGFNHANNISIIFE